MSSIRKHTSNLQLSVDTGLITCNILGEHYKWYYLDNNKPVYLGSHPFVKYKGDGFYTCKVVAENVLHTFQINIKVGGVGIEYEKIGHWDLNKLPTDKVTLLIQLISEEKVSEIVELHDEYKLSDYVYCCGYKGALKHARKAIDIYKKENK